MKRGQAFLARHGQLPSTCEDEGGLEAMIMLYCISIKNMSQNMLDCDGSIYFLDSCPSRLSSSAARAKACTHA